MHAQHDEADRPRTRDKIFGLVSGRKIAVLLFGLLMAVGGYALSYVGDDQAEMQNRAIDEYVENTPGVASRRFLTDEQQAEIKADALERGRSAWQWMSPHLTRLGISLAIGLVAGIFFRAFVVKAAAFTALAAVGLGALAYFQVLDFSTLQTNYEAARETAQENATSVKDWIMSFAPSTTGAIIGFGLGFLRK